CRLAEQNKQATVIAKRRSRRLIFIQSGRRSISTTRINCSAPRLTTRNELRTLNDAVVAFRAGAKRLKRLLVSLAFVSRQRGVITVEFDNDRPLLQSRFAGLNLACGLGQKASPE